MTCTVSHRRLAPHGVRPCRLARRGRCVNVAVLSGGVGGARFLRGLVGVVDPGDVTIVGNVADDLEVLGLRLARSGQHPLHAHRPLGRGARLEAPTRAGGRSRRSPSSPASRGSASAIAISACISSAPADARGCDALGGDRADLACVRTRARAVARNRQSGANVSRDSGRHLSVPDLVRRSRSSRRSRCRSLRRRT